MVIAKPYDQTNIDEEQRFSSVTLVEDLTHAGVEAITLDDADQIAQTVGMRAHPEDVIAVLSNGGFDGLHGKILDVLKTRFPAG